MVGKSFRRSLTFPITSYKSPTVSRLNGRGSASLPSRFHPLVARIEDEIHSLREWTNLHSQQQSTSSSAWISEELARLDHLHRSLLGDLLQHPQARDSILPECAGAVVDDFLRLADAYSSFRSAIVNLKQEQSATQAAIRRKDGPRIAACFRSQRKTEKEIVKIAAGIMGKTGKWAASADTAEAELVGIVSDVVTVTLTVSTAVFRGIVGLSSATATATASTSRAHSFMGRPMVRRLSSFNHKEEEEEEEDKWRRNALERLEALEECLGEVEAVTDKLFRSLINTRVFLLNVLTPSW